MKAKWIPMAAVALLTFCSPGGERRAETGMAGDTGWTGDTMTLTGAAGDTAAVPGGSDTGRATARSGSGALSDADVLSRLAVSDQNEIQIAQYAARQARSPEVRQFARTLQKDHQQSIGQGRSLMKEIGAAPAEDARTQAAGAIENTDMAGKTGAEFDRAFVDHQVELHRKALDRVRNEFLPAAQNRQLRTHLQNLLPTLEEHLATAQRLQQQLQQG